MEKDYRVRIDVFFLAIYITFIIQFIGSIVDDNMLTALNIVFVIYLLAVFNIIDHLKGFIAKFKQRAELSLNTLIYIIVGIVLCISYFIGQLTALVLIIYKWIQ